jgi:hypothetical protein
MNPVAERLFFRYTIDTMKHPLIALLAAPCVLVLSSCTAEDADYFWNGPSGGYSSSSSDQQQWRNQVRQAEYQQQSQAYRSGFTTTPPAGYSQY